ncbi:hypothetical protein MMC20_006252 [Loxospora ochrophaea]|nr:hypothetical protein [Loxospora ochrophaea]
MAEYSQAISRTMVKPPKPSPTLLSSHIVDLEDSQSELQSDDLCQNDDPSSFLALDASLRKQILGLVLSRDYPIHPYYNQGSLEVPEYLVETPNVDLSILLVNKQLNKEASDLFYGENIFVLDKPIEALWWLRRIGGSVTKVRRTVFHLSSGILDGHLNTWEERLWLNVITWIAPRHEIREIAVSFDKWLPLGGAAFQGEDLALAEDARFRILDILHSFGGMSYVEIYGGRFLTSYEKRDLEDSMLLDKVESKVPKRVRKRSLGIKKPLNVFWLFR